MKVFELLIGTSTFDGAEYLHFLESRLLMEVVLHTPIEAVLGPYIKAAPSEAVQKWLQTNFKNWLMKSPVDLYRLPYLPVNADEKQKKAYGFQDLYDIRMSPDTQTKLEHAMDFFRANPGLTRIDRMTFEQVLAAADAQVEASKRAAMKSAHLAEPETDAKTIMEFPGGYRMVELLTQKALDREGGLMDHCIGSMHGQYLRAGTHRMFSLRDSENQPHATVEITKDDMRSREIKGKGNRPPVRRYWPMLRAFIEKLGVQTHSDYMNVGYLQISDPETGEPMTMTQDQFKDMVLDPDNQQGTQFLKRLGTGEFSSNQLNFHHRRRHDDNDDLMLGLFTALYGSDRMTDGLIQHVFSRMPTHAIQVVEAHGNRLTPDQLMGAFMSISGSDLDQHYKALIIASKPNVDIVREIIPELSEQRALDRDGKPREWSEKADEFVTALFQVQPDVYGQYLKQGGPEVVDNELKERGDRAAGPFFVFAETGGLTPLMVQRAFRAFPSEAFRRAKKLDLKFIPDWTVAAFRGLEGKYWSDDASLPQFLDLFVPYVKPDAETTKRVFSEIIDLEDGEDSRRNNRENEFAAKILVAFRKHVPESVNKDTMESALIAINIDKGLDDYLAVEPNPGVGFQHAMFKRSLKRETGQVRGIQNVDPSLYPMTVALLKAEEPARTKTSTEYVRDKKTGKNLNDKHGNPRKYEKTVSLDPEEIAKDKASKRGTALTTFTRMFGQIVRTPGPAEAPIDMSAPKFLAAKKWFDENGYGRLFTAAVRKVGRSNAFHNMVGQNNYNSRGDRTAFTNNLPDMSPNDIVQVIGGSFSYREDWFADVVNVTPEKVPGVIVASLKPGRYGRQPTAAYGKMDFKGLDKEKTFRSLEHVWASTIVPEGIKDAYTALCFKRFKPNKEILIDMLDRAGSEDAVAYVVKKTKNPSPELIQFLIDNDYAGELLEIKKVLPVDVLKQVFEKYPKIARMLMHRDLRGYGTDETRRKWATKKFRNKLDRESDAFKQYEAAAKAAGKADEFAVYARHAELEDMHDEIVPFDQTKRTHTVDLNLVKKHLKDFSIRSLKHFIEHDDGGKVTKFLFTKLPVEKIAQLIQAGSFKAHHWHQREQGERDKIIQWMEETDPSKVRESVKAALPHEEAWTFIGRLLDFGSKFDEDFIYNAVANGKPVNGYRSDEPYKKLIGMSKSAKLKDWVADNDPGSMDQIKVPTPHMVDVLFDKYGNFTKSYKGHYTPSSSFSSAVLSWFNKKDGSRYDFSYMPNPAAMKLLHAAAMKRGYTAAAITRAMFQYIARLRDKQSKDEFSVLHNDPVMSPLARSLAPSGEDR